MQVVGPLTTGMGWTFAIACSDIGAVVEGPPRYLIESLASAIADTILQRHPLVQVHQCHACCMS